MELAGPAPNKDDTEKDGNGSLSSPNPSMATTLSIVFAAPKVVVSEPRELVTTGDEVASAAVDKPLPEETEVTVMSQSPVNAEDTPLQLALQFESSYELERSGHQAPPIVEPRSLTKEAPTTPVKPAMGDLLALDNVNIELPPPVPVPLLPGYSTPTLDSLAESSNPLPVASPFRLDLQDIAMSPQDHKLASSSSFASSGRKSAPVARLTLDATASSATPRQKLSPLHVEVPASPRRSSKTSMASPPQPISVPPSEDVASDWMVCRTDAGDIYYYNVKRQESQWTTPQPLEIQDHPPPPPPLHAPIDYEADCLHVAVSNGDLVRVQDLLAAGIATDGLDDDGRTPLWYALEHLEIAVLLLNQGHSSKHQIVAPDMYGTTLLHVVTRQRNIEMLTLLLLQADPSDESAPFSEPMDVDARDSHQQTALHVAATFGFRKCVEMLLAHGASPAVLDENSQTPIMLATLGGHVGSVQLLQVALSALLKQTEVAVQSEPVPDATRVHQLQEQVAASAKALEENQRANDALRLEVDTYRYNLSVQLREKEALETAYRIANSRLAMLEALAKRTKEDHDHEKLLWQQKEAGYVEAHRHSMEATKSLQHDVDALLSTHFPSPHLKSSTPRSSPVPTPSKDTSPGKRSRLPSSNAVTEDISYEHAWALDHHDTDPMDGHQALYHEHHQLDQHQLYPTHDFTPNQHTSPPRPSAARVDAVWAQFFTNAAAAASTKMDDEPSDRGLMQAVLDADMDDVQARLTNGETPNMRDSLRRTSLHLATDRGDTAMLALLCDFLGDIEARDAKGNTPLHIACFRGHVGCVKFLLESASEVHVVNADGESVVHAAASGGSLPCLRLVLEYGASPLDRNHDGETAYDMLLELDGPVAPLLDCLQEAMAPPPKHTKKTFRGTPVPPAQYTSVEDDIDEFVSPPSSPLPQLPPHEVHIYDHEDDVVHGDLQHRGMTPDGWGGVRLPHARSMIMTIACSGFEARRRRCLDWHVSSQSTMKGRKRRRRH
ncbi:hypothetical protein, variant 1 [Aphanomyces astaci]|uniref:WW domain-containing protein n=1 Tax=Aphanomyces astaci TaxID=112090 RepID=W4HBM6_APHAT|nr:hypothetical protein, variant 1 [Aphanomyces astaci]ETV89415.1 hypothetical protein, variant 1 [Aphanomyces astaci]|eukprot:XP_009821815.1 hypothetical protein, variant 1 [Aphanomyces astaci]